MTEKNKGKKLLTWTLALSMTLALPPVGVFAEDGAAGEGSQQTNSAPATEQLGGSSNESGTANNKTTEPTSTPAEGGQKNETAPSLGTSGAPASSGEGQNGENETLKPLLAPVSGGEAKESEDSTTPSEGKDGSEGGNEGGTTGEVVTYAATIKGKEETTYETLQAAIDAAQEGDTVVLAKNVTQNININKSITLDLNGKTLTADEGERAIEITPTVDFSEDFKKDLRQHSITDPYFPNIDFKSSSLFSKYEEKYKETFSTIPIINVKIKNGTITGGDLSTKQDNENSQAFIRCGGGIRISSCEVELENCNIEGNKARYGGGIFCSNSTVTINGGTISGNTAVDGHGSLYAAGGGISSFRSELTINGVQITGNTANKSGTSYGGGLGVRGGSLIMTDTTISKNTAIQSGGGICIGPVNNYGKSIFPVEFTITGCTIERNESGTSGGGIWIDAVNDNESDYNHITRTTIQNNTGGSYAGGGIHLSVAAKLEVTNSTIAENNAQYYGGGINVSGGNLRLIHTKIAKNNASNGSGMYVQSISGRTSTISLSDNTEICENNTTGYGGGIYTYPLAEDAIINMTIQDSSIYNNEAATGAGIFAYSNFKNTLDVSIQSGSKLYDNETSGLGGAIYAKNATLAINQNAAIYNNKANNGGGIYATESIATVADNSMVYNNTADTAGDDLYILGEENTLSLADAKTMSGDRKLAPDGKEITGWFYDGHKTDTSVPRWQDELADGSKYYNEYPMKENAPTEFGLKAAYKPAPPSGGGGGGGGHRPKPKPTVEIPDDDALGLNNTDHFAYIVGYGHGEVQPQNSITRAEVAAIFFRLLEDGIRSENFTHQNDFSDVAADAWYCSSVSTLSRMGIIAGYPDGTFRPNAPITRAEFAAIATRFDNNGDKTPVSFTDIIGHWAEGEITVAANHGWVSGYGDDTFRPQNQITRAETMSLVNRVLKRLPETPADLLPDMITWTDNADTSSWYYLPVQEATNSHYYEFKENSKHEKWTELRETRDWSKLN